LTLPLLFSQYLDMEESHLTRPYLESLSTDELVKMADSFGIDIPPGLERIFIIEELLDFVYGDESAPGDDLGDRPDFVETTVLPRQYNISYIEVMIRDPLWAFVFWEAKSQDKELHEKAHDFEGYCLRVIALQTGDEQALPAAREHSFTVPVGVNDTAWYLGFPPAEGRYQVKLCALRETAEHILAVSRPFRMPRLREPPNRFSLPDIRAVPDGALRRDIPDIYQDPLACLSGVRDFTLIRSVDRQSRTKGKGALC
jgi:hypothetical protein